ncbi:TraB/GumN family protein [Prevotella sp. 10(H)]|uniref:TraB/GumN family protein n=1 Tax=Prevotella sp. 10(H) TaxID=1158294 RepID=UPI0004A6C027|nr:TraB/GumN family protein [Prevotella sp. 10(H)]
MKTLTSVIFSVILFFLSVSAGWAQKAKQFDGALLWKVSGNGLSQPSYILGTHHLTHVSFVDSIPGLKDAMKNTQQTVGELLLSDQAAMQAKVQQAAMMPAGQTYDKLLSKEDYATLDEGLKSIIGVGLDQFGMFKPGMISVAFTIKLYSKFYPGFNPMSHEPIDLYVQRIAKENNKAVSGLETVEDQIYALFDFEPLKEQAEALVCAAKTVDQAKEQLEKFETYYRAGKLVALYDLTFNNPDDPCQLSQKQAYALGKERNDKWMLKLPQIMSDASSLVAVGVMHLAGEEGLLNQLAQKGYTVEPVK